MHTQPLTATSSILLYPLYMLIKNIHFFPFSLTIIVHLIISLLILLHVSIYETNHEC